MGMLFLFLIYLSFYGVRAEDEFSIDTEITIPQGKIKGSFNLAGSMKRFLGIPYASMNGRFQNPGVARTWSGTFDATKEPAACTQLLNLFHKVKLPVGTEDCLTLNIFTPISAVTEKLPVMVYIHGGGYFWGSDTDLVFDPSYLVEKNNVVITINYRLGVFGFLCLKNEGAPGNVGLKDQVAALKWIKENIEYFGGNSQSITLFGQDVGAASINYFLLLSSTKDLFNRAILQSGSVLMPQAFDDNPIESASAIAAESGFNSTDPDELLQFFNDLPMDELVRVTSRDSTKDPFAPYVFRPCIETSTTGSLITDHPRDLLKSANLSSDVQVIIGYNNGEGIHWATKLNYTDLSSLLKNLSNIILPNYLHFQDEDDKTSFVKDVKDLYINNETDRTSVEKGLIDFFSDAYIMYPSVAVSEYILANTNATVYNYQFSYFSIRNLAKLVDGTHYYQYQGADHGDELFYLFSQRTSTFPLPAVPYPNDVIMIYRMSMMWSYFALTGNPSVPKESRLPYPIEWTRSKLNDLKFLNIFSNVEMIPLPNKKRIDFWKNTYMKYGIEMK